MPSKFISHFSADLDLANTVAESASLNVLVAKRKELFLNIVLAILFTTVTVYTFLWISEGYEFFAATGAITAVLCVVLYFHTKLKIPFPIVAQLTIGLASLSIYTSTSITYRYSPMMIAYFTATPLAALLLVGRRATFLWTLTNAVLIASLPYGSKLFTAKFNLPDIYKDYFNIAQALTLLFALGVFIYMMDKLSRELISTLMRNKKELEHGRSELLELQRIRNRFFASMSHEIRTPLNAIRGISNLLLHSNLDSENRNLSQSLNRSSSHLLSLVNDLLDLSKLEDGNEQIQNVEFDLREVLYDAYTIVRYAANEKSLSMRLEIDSNLPKFVIADPNRLRQILVNLLNNAVKFTPEGEVLLACNHILRESDSQDLLHLEIKDTGIGIADEAKPRIFQIYNQADEFIGHQYGGTGLGLYITRKLVELQKGRIWFESTLGKGSTFYAEIPIVVTKLVDPPSKTDLPCLVDDYECTVMLTEDNALNVTVATKLLQRHMPRCRILEAANGQEAIQLLEQHDDIDVILMDLHMPVMNGLDATRYIRSQNNPYWQAIPIIAMTANTSNKDIADCQAVGMNDFIYKPFDIQVLLMKISKHVKNQTAAAPR